MLPFNETVFKFKSVCTGFGALLKRGEAVERRPFDDMTLEYFTPVLWISSSGLYRGVLTERQET